MRWCPEDFDERLEALTRAWSLARTLLVVSVMLANQNDPRGERFRDGVMARRGTFQKYYAQGEIKAFLEEVLDEEAIPVAPGVHYVFRDKDAEQRLLVNRHRRRRNLLRIPPRPDHRRPTSATAWATWSATASAPRRTFSSPTRTCSKSRAGWLATRPSTGCTSMARTYRSM
jgi:DNA phosphorothioation-associated putative methyltransferase